VVYAGGPLVAFLFLVKFYQLKDEECEKVNFWDFNCQIVTKKKDIARFLCHFPVGNEQ